MGWKRQGRIAGRFRSAELAVAYAAQPPLTRREEWLQQYFFVGQFVDDLADLEGDGLVNLIEYAFAFSPLAQNPAGSGLEVVPSPAGENTEFTITFRRDPRVTDLVYRLQTSGDLSGWTTIVESVAGATPTGTGFLSEAVVPGESPILLVTARETLPAGSNRFARLVVVRQP